MLLPRRIWALALSAASVTAFKDTSPLLLFSSGYDITFTKQQSLIRSDTALERIGPILDSCQWSTYIVANQPSISSQDLFENANSVPHLRRWASNETSMSSFIVPEVLGLVDDDAIVKRLEKECKVIVEDVDSRRGYVFDDVESRRVIRTSFTALASTKQTRRVEMLQEHDAFLGTLVQGFPKDTLIIYTTTPLSSSTSPSHNAPHHELHLYENEDPFEQGLHVDLKRDFAPRQESNNNTSLPLFETYSYFNPAIFTAILVSVLLFLMLYVGVSAVAGVEVSYFAFSKEMGPAQQKKQQQ